MFSFLTEIVFVIVSCFIVKQTPVPGIEVNEYDLKE